MLTLLRTIRTHNLCSCTCCAPPITNATASLLLVTLRTSQNIGFNFCIAAGGVSFNKFIILGEETINNFCLCLWIALFRQILIIKTILNKLFTTSDV